MPRITFVNHASVLIESGNIRLLTDPWIEGPAFNEGWELLVPTVFTYEDFRRVTHIWFSHEHPDHFSPLNLQRIHKDARGHITVLYQRTQDKKVPDFVERLGFRFQELPPYRWVEIGPDFRVLNGPVPFYDSWLAVETDHIKLVNLNDCELNTPAHMQTVRRHTSAVDILLSQFGYANWAGDRLKLAERVLDRLTLQAKMLEARFTIPFASFIRFCHEENQFMNDSINRVANAAEAIRQQTTSHPVVLFPGDTWEIGQLHNNTPVLEQWAVAYASLPVQPLRSSKPVPLAELERLGQEYLKRVRTKNNRFCVALGYQTRFFPRVILHLTDLDIAVSFDLWRGVVGLAGKEVSPDVALASESLAFILKFDYGLDTVYVNGRFQATESGKDRMVRAFALGALNNTGRSFGPGLACDPVFLRQAPAVLGQLLRGGNRISRTRQPSRKE